MIDGLAELLSLSQEVLWIGFAVFLRIGAMIALVPVFGEQSVPARIRLILAGAFTLIVAPAVAPAVAVNLGGLGGLDRPPLPFLIAETLTGLFLGILLRLIMLVLSVAGAIAAQSTSLSQIFGGSAGIEPQPAIGHLLVVGGLTIAVILGLHVRLAAMMIASYDLYPPGILPTAQTISTLGLAQIAATFSLAFSLAAPFVVASVIYNVLLGVINRAMPQLMVSFVGAPFITAGALFLMLMSMPLLLAIWVEALNGFMADPSGPVR